MQKLFEMYSGKILGAISGWDRIRFRGTIRWLASTEGMGSYLGTREILLKDFGRWAESLTKRVRAACGAQAERLGIPTIYLRRSGVDKDALARRLATERGQDIGDICMFSVVEPCRAPQVRGDRESKRLHVEMAERKCVFVYHYWNDPIVGFGHTRLQSWLPLTVTVCINGRHWLERQLSAESIDYVKDGNCFPYIADLGRAQVLLDTQLNTDWPTLLNGLLRRNCPIINDLFDDLPLAYYWSADETEWATDTVFRTALDLEQLYPSLLRYGLVSAQSPAVMRFFGRKTPSGRILGRVPAEIVSDHRQRYEGVRLKHWLNGNSIKAYNKAGNLLRLETTINNPRDFKVFRPANDDATKPATWQKMRKGVSDLHRRAHVSQACNDRYAEHLAAAAANETLHQVASDICARVKKKDRSYRAVNPWNYDDFRMLQFLGRGENSLNGFRNRDVRRWLYPQSSTSTDRTHARYTSGQVTRRLQLFRAHGLIKKVPRTSRYLLTPKGRKVTTALLAASSVDTQRLLDLVA